MKSLLAMLLLTALPGGASFQHGLLVPIQGDLELPSTTFSDGWPDEWSEVADGGFIVADNDDTDFLLNSNEAANRNDFDASFDCSLASTQIEILICSNQELATSDMEMSSVYFFIRDNAELSKEERDRILDDQRNWLGARSVVCDLVD